MCVAHSLIVSFVANHAKPIIIMSSMETSFRQTTVKEIWWIVQCENVVRNVTQRLYTPGTDSYICIIYMRYPIHIRTHGRTHRSSYKKYIFAYIAMQINFPWSRKTHKNPFSWEWVPSFLKTDQKLKSINVVVWKTHRISYFTRSSRSSA